MLTPIDIQNHVLKSTMGGYNKKETDDFIAEVQSSYEELYKENHDLKEKISTLSEGLQYYKQMETTLQKALVLAEKTSAETLDAAKEKAAKLEEESTGKADEVIAEAQTKADSLLDEATKKADSVLADATQKAKAMIYDTTKELKERTAMIEKLVSYYEDYRSQLKALANRQLQLLDSKNFEITEPGMEDILAYSDSVVGAEAEPVADEGEGLINDEDLVTSTSTISVEKQEKTVTAQAQEPVQAAATAQPEVKPAAAETQATGNPFTFIDAK